GQFDIEIIPRLAAGRGRKSTVAMTMPFPQLIDSFWEAVTLANSGKRFWRASCTSNWSAAAKKPSISLTFFLSVVNI
ncbi:hypothetical protein ACFFT4_23245, partial [Cohnella cellulosilytica]|uniref:hypothetical protein n=1 Tax=Cohnella cellulosilytica TaxID=986710 RepID=UPI0035ED1B42